MKLYLDDIRTPKDSSFKIVRSYAEAVDYVKENGIPHYISFDHDLGVDEKKKELPSGYDFAKWLVEMDMDSIYSIPIDFEFNVHSANPVGKENIESYLNGYLKFRNNEFK